MLNIDFRDRRNSHTHDSMHTAQHYSSRSRCYPSSPNARVGGNATIDPVNSGYLSLTEGNLPLSPSAPPTERLALHGAQLSGYSSNYQLVPVDDSPPSYEECVLPRVRLQNANNGRNGNGARNSKNKTSSNTTQPKKPSSNALSSPEQNKDKENYWNLNDVDFNFWIFWINSLLHTVKIQLIFISN